MSIDVVPQQISTYLSMQYLLFKYANKNYKYTWKFKQLYTTLIEDMLIK